MKGRRTAMVVGVLTMITITLVVALGGDRLAESWYLLRLRSDDETIRQAALEGLAEFGSVRSVPALLEVILTDGHEAAYVRDGNRTSNRFRTWVEGCSDCVVAAHDYSSSDLLLTPAVATLYCLGEEALRVSRESDKVNIRRIQWALDAFEEAHRHRRFAVHLLTPKEARNLLSGLEYDF